MKHLGMTIELDPKRDKITCPAFGLYSSPAEYSTMGHFGFGFDESCVPDKIAWADRSKNQQIQLAHENWTKMMTINPLVCPDNVTVSEDEDDEPLVRPSSELIKEKRDSADITLCSYTVTKQKRTSSLAETHLLHWNKICQETRVSDHKKSRYWAEIQTVKLFATS